MLATDMNEWMDKMSTEPFASKVFFRELFTDYYPNCTCRVEGKLAIVGKVNKCLTCFHHMSSLDAHLHVDRFDLALIGWLSLVWKGESEMFLYLGEKMPSKTCFPNFYL